MITSSAPNFLAKVVVPSLDSSSTTIISNSSLGTDCDVNECIHSPIVDFEL